MIGTIVGAAALLLGGALVYDRFVRPYNAYVVQLVPSLGIEQHERVVDQVLSVPGVRGVSGFVPPTTESEITVFFRDGLSEHQRARLGQRLLLFPQVTEVKLCRC